MRPNLSSGEEEVEEGVAPYEVIVVIRDQDQLRVEYEKEGANGYFLKNTEIAVGGMG